MSSKHLRDYSEDPDFALNTVTIVPGPSPRRKKYPGAHQKEILARWAKYPHHYTRDKITVDLSDDCDDDAIMEFNKICEKGVYTGLFECLHPICAEKSLVDRLLLVDMNVKTNVPHKYTLIRHHLRHQPEIKKMTKKRATDISARFVGNCNLPYSIFASPGGVEFLQHLIPTVIGKDGISDTDIKDSMRRQVKDLENYLLEMLPTLVKNRAICLLLDHWSKPFECPDSSGKYLGIVCGIRNLMDDSTIYARLKFANVPDTSTKTTLDILLPTLEELKMLDDFMAGHIPIVGNNTLATGLGNNECITTTCLGKTYSNIMERFLDKAQENEIFKNDFETIKEVLRDVNHEKKRDGVATTSLNLFRQKYEVTEDDIEHMAQYDNDNGKYPKRKLTNVKQRKIPSIDKLCDIKIRDVYNSMKGLLCAKLVIEKYPVFVSDVCMNWALVKLLFDISRILSKALDNTESNNSCSAMNLSNLIKLLLDFLRMDSTDLFQQIFGVLIKTVIEYIFGSRDVQSHAETFPRIGLFATFESRRFDMDWLADEVVDNPHLLDEDRELFSGLIRSQSRLWGANIEDDLFEVIKRSDTVAADKQVQDANNEEDDEFLKQYTFLRRSRNTQKRSSHRTRLQREIYEYTNFSELKYHEWLKLNKPTEDFRGLKFFQDFEYCFPLIASAVQTSFISPAGCGSVERLFGKTPTSNGHVGTSIELSVKTKDVRAMKTLLSNIKRKHYEGIKKEK